MLLNNDLRLTPNFLQPLARHFDRNDVFSVSATSFDWEGMTATCGPFRLTHQHGWYRWICELGRQERSYTLFTTGGFSAVSREKFIALGGFNRLFYPAYGEDLDLCFRAWRRNWVSVFEPASIVFHRDKGSWGEVAGANVTKMDLRAQLLFSWSSLPPAASVSERYAMCAWILLHNLWHGNRWCVRVWYDALCEWLTCRRDYRWMKASKQELSDIQAQVNQSFPRCDD